MRLGMKNTCCGLNLTNTVGAEQLHSVIRFMVGRLKVEHVTLLSRCSKNAAAVEPKGFLFVKIRESYALCLLVISLMLTVNLILLFNTRSSATLGLITRKRSDEK